MRRILLAGALCLLAGAARAQNIPNPLPVTQALAPWTIIGTSAAGTFTGNVLNVQDVGLNLAQGSTTSGQYGPLMQAAVLTSAPSDTTGQTSPLTMTTKGEVRTNISQSGTQIFGGQAGDAQSSQNGLYTVTYPELWNGSNNDRARDASAGATGLKAGVQVEAAYGYNGSTWDAIKDDANAALSVNLADFGGTVISTTNPVPVASQAPARAARNFPGCTVGTSSGQCLASSTAVTFVQVENTSASASIACAWGATAVLNSAGSFQLAAGQGASWGVNTGGVPTGALNCIASGASTPMYLEWN
jgi:hypothetical protein